MLTTHMIIALQFPEGIWKTIRSDTMYRPCERDDHERFVVIQVPDTSSSTEAFKKLYPQPQISSTTLNFSAMKLFNRFRKIVTRLIFSFPSSHHHNTSSSSSSGKTRQKNCDRFDLPKTSCSSYYSSHSHYDEAIADCIEFFNKSAQDGNINILDDPKSPVFL